MKRYLLPQSGCSYKANLHCHSTVSDGNLTPEEIKETYREQGYSVVAFTDHEVLIPHNDLTDDTFLALNGVEIQIKENKPVNAQVCHMCFISPCADVPPQPCIHREKYFIGNGKEYFDKVKYDKSAPDYERIYSPERINDVIRRYKEKGFFATYNHPSWSLENYMNYMNYNGFDAMEILNGLALNDGYDDYNPRVYQDMLMGGKKLFCIGADDNHNKKPKGSTHFDSGLAYIMIKAEKLDYESVFSAIKCGNFYTSEAPEIYELYIEDDMVHIKCSPAYKIFCNYGIRKASSVIAEHNSYVTDATFCIPDECIFFRITVIDKNGKRACTNAYFVDDLMK